MTKPDIDKLSDKDLAQIKLLQRTTREHYLDEHVSRTIIGLSRNGNTFRAGNVDMVHWYKRKNDKVQLWDLSNRKDYEAIIKKGRSLYWTLNFFDPWLKSKTKPADLGEKKLGTFKETDAYSLGVDIDSKDEIWKPKIKEAVEKMAQFFVDEFKKSCPTSVYACFSGGGIYVYIHPEVFKAKISFEDNKEYLWRLLTGCFNAYITGLQEQFYEKYPSYKNKVKADAINNQKRVFKTIFSVHKRYPFAVIPLDTKNIFISFKDALIPLSKEIKTGGLQWMKKGTQEEARPLVIVLEKYKDKINIKNFADDGQHAIYKLKKRADIQYFPPCIKNILSMKKPTTGATRMKTFLLTFLAQAGYSEDKANEIFKEVSSKLGGSESNIFKSWFGRMSCPNCKTVQTKGSGFPKMEMGETNICIPDELCAYIKSPFNYLQKSLEYKLSEQQKKLEDVYKTAKKFLYITDTKRIDVILATALSNKIYGTPIWMFIAGNSGDWKSAFARSLEGLPNCKVVDQITKNTLASGMKDVGDLGHELQNKDTILLFPDLASLTSMNSDDKNSIWGEFRNLYDGFINKRTGSGVKRKYENCHVSMLACTTQAIRDEVLIHAQLGTRELLYDTNANPVDNNEKMCKAWENEAFEERMKREIQQSVVGFIVQKKIKDIEISEEMKQFLMKEAQRLTILRASAMTDRRYRELFNPVYPEVPTRVIKQFKRLYITLKSLDDDYQDARAKEIISHIVNSSGNKVRQMIMDILKKSTVPLKIRELQQETRIGRSALKSQLEILWNLDVITKHIIEERIGGYVSHDEFNNEFLRGGRIEEVAYYGWQNRKIGENDQKTLVEVG